MAREKFAPRRATTTINFPHKYHGRGDADMVCGSFSRLPSGRIGEAWINSINGYEKLVTDDLRDSCVILSKDLQNGDTLEYLSKSLMRDGRGRAHGVMGSFIDALKKESADA